MNIRRGEIHLASFVFPHERTTKTRPVLVLQCDEDNENPYYPFVLIAPLTTRKVETIYQQDVFLPKGEGDLKEDSKVLLGALTAMKKTSEDVSRSTAY